jgi:hypothetical protein
LPYADDPTVINIADQLDNTVEQLLLSDAVSDIDIVSLEVNEDNLFRRIDYVVMSDTNLIIGGVDRGALRYNMEGRFINAIGTKGQGPGEFLYTLGLILDSVNQTICIIGTSGSSDFKTLDYILDGTFLRSGQIPSSRYRGYFNLNVNVNCFHSVRDNIFILPQLYMIGQDTDCFSFLKYNTATNEFRKFYNPANFGHEEDYIAHRPGSSSSTYEYWHELSTKIISYGEHESVLFEHNDTIYCFSPAMDSLQVRYIMNCGVRPDFGTAHAFSKDISFYKYIYVSRMLESKEYVYLVVGKSDNLFLLRFDKRNGSIRTIRENSPVERSPNMNIYYRQGVETPPGFTNDLCGGLPFYPRYVDRHHWIARYEVHDLLEKIDIEKLRNADVLMPEKRDKLVNILEHLDEDDNPLLMIATLK